MRLAKELEGLGAEIVPALEELPVCAFLIDRDGRVRWQSSQLTKVFGDLRGRPAEIIVAPEDQARTRKERAQKLLGVKRTSDYDIHLLLPNGKTRPVEINSVALDDGYHIVGIFGILHRLQALPEQKRVTTKLTPRQHEVLRLIARGHSTRQIAEELHLSVETVRNHVRGILKGLGVHSRIEALAVALREHLL